MVSSYKVWRAGWPTDWREVSLAAPLLPPGLPWVCLQVDHQVEVSLIAQLDDLIWISVLFIFHSQIQRNINIV